jgi:hypothetical protein
MPTYKLTTVSTQFVYGSPEQLHRFVTDLPACEALTELSQMDDLDLPEGVTPISLGCLEILENGGESPQAWATLAKAQLDRLGVSLDVSPLSELEAEGYSGNRYERFLWLGSSSLKLLFPAVDLVIGLNQLTPAQVEADEFWDSLYTMALGHDSCYLPTCQS